MITQEQKTIDTKEFISVLMSCELAAEFNKDKPNRAIKATLKKCQNRVTSESIKKVCEQGMSQVFPMGWLNRQFNNIGRMGNLSRGEFIKIGLSL